jgi:hypothetical protein
LDDLSQVGLAAVRSMVCGKKRGRREDKTMADLYGITTRLEGEV